MPQTCYNSLFFCWEHFYYAARHLKDKISYNSFKVKMYKIYYVDYIFLICVELGLAIMQLKMIGSSIKIYSGSMFFF